MTPRRLTPVDEEASAPPLFLPAAMEAPTDAPPKKRARRGGRPADDPAQLIELEVDGGRFGSNMARRRRQSPTVAA
jgi:hypothetical protein